MKKINILLTLLLLTSCNNNNSHPISEKTVKNYQLNYNVSYTGTLKNGKPEGKGTFKYRNNDTLSTTFKDGKIDNNEDSTYKIMASKDKFIGKISMDEDYNVSYIEGTYDYGVGVNIYTGKFKDNKFNDENGKMKLSSNSYYVGSFVDGSNIGQIGTIYFDGNKEKGEGIFNFKGVMKSLSTFVVNQIGYGVVKYADKSVYTGDLLYDGTSFLRKGFGEMDFTETNMNAGIWGTSNDNMLYKYVGEFDYSVNGWIYGNGIMYYKDKKGNPVSYAKGYFSACHLLGEYQKDDYTLIDGYTKEMEAPYLRFRENYDYYLSNENYEYKHYEYVFAGSSYMTFMNTNADTPFSKYFGSLNAINVGCGGSTSADWINYYDTLIKPYTPNNIVMHIGGNDIANFAKLDMIEQSVKKFIDKCLFDNPNVKIYLVTQLLTVSTQSTYIQREQVNKILEKVSNDYENVKLIDVRSVTMTNIDNWTPVDNLSSYFLNDGLHLNDKGYTKWSKIIMDYLAQEEI